jgi:Fe-S-cluster containining protein
MKCNIPNSKNSKKNFDTDEAKASASLAWNSHAELVLDLSIKEQTKRIGLDDTFAYGCVNCEECCCDQKISLTPRDAYTLAKGLNMTYDDFLAKICIPQFSPPYGVPMLYLKTVGNHKTCVLRNSNAGCIVENFKPTICALHPLGRYIPNTKCTPDNIRYFLTPCPYSALSKTTSTVREWLEKNNVQIKDQFFCDWVTAVHNISDTLEILHKTLNEECFSKVHISLLGFLYFEYDLSAEFEPQFSEKIEKIHAYLEWNLNGRKAEDDEAIY